MADEEKTEPTEEEIEARDLSKAQEGSPHIHEEGVRVSDMLADGEVDETEKDEQLQD